MKRVFLTALRFTVLPVLLLLGALTGGADGLVGWLVLGWMIWRGGPAMWRDVKNACRWFFGLQRRYSVRGLFGGRSRGGELNV